MKETPLYEPFKARLLVDVDTQLHVMEVFSEDLPDRDKGKRSISEWASESMQIDGDNTVSLLLDCIKKTDEAFEFQDGFEYEIVCDGEISWFPGPYHAPEEGSDEYGFSNVKYAKREYKR